MALQIKAGVLKRNQNDYSPQKTIYTQVFNTEKIANIRFGYLLPYKDNGLGDVTYSDSFVQSATLPRADALIGADFYYIEDDNRRVRYFIDGTSIDIQTALDNTASEAQFVTIATANSKTHVG